MSCTQHGFDAGLTANAAAGSRIEVPLQVRGGEFKIVTQRRTNVVVDPSVCTGGTAVFDTEDVIDRTYDTFSEQKSSDQFMVMTGCPHGNGQRKLIERRAIDANF